MPTHNGLRYWEKMLPFGAPPKGTVNPEAESRMSTTVWIAWDDLLDGYASSCLLGHAAAMTAGALDYPAAAAGTRYLARTNPLTHADWANDLYIASDMEWEGDKAEGIGPRDTATFDEARINLNFRSYPGGYRVLPDADVIDDNVLRPGYATPQEYFGLRNMAWEIKPVMRPQTIPAPSGLVWSSTGEAVSASNFIILYEADITCTWWPLPVDGFNEPGFRDIANTGNKFPWPPSPPAGAPASLMPQLPAMTLVIGQVTPALIRMGDGSQAYKVTIKYRYHPYGVNYWYNHRRRPTGPAGAVVPGYDLTLAPGGAQLYQQGDWHRAFMPP
jgi:hypothetical protein